MKRRCRAVVATLASLAAIAIVRRAARTRTRRRRHAGEGREIIDGLASSFAVPWRDLFKGKHDSEWRNLLDGFTGELVIDGPLTTPDVPGRTAPLRWSDTRLSASSEVHAARLLVRQRQRVSLLERRQSAGLES